MADDSMDSDACVGFKRRIPDFKETPILDLHQQQESTNSCSAVSTTPQLDNDSNESSPLKEDQDFIQHIPSPSKKVKSSFTPTPHDNQHVFAFCDGEKGVIGDLVSGSCVCDGNNEDLATKIGDFDTVQNKEMLASSCGCDVNSEEFSTKVGDLDVQFQETEKKQEIFASSAQEQALLYDLVSESFVCDVNSVDFSKTAENLDVQLQETDNFVSVGEAGTEQVVNNGVIEVCKTMEVGKDSVLEESKETMLEAKKKQLLAKVEGGSLFKDKNRVDSSLGFENTVGILGGLKGIDESVKRSLKVQVIDDTALIGTVPVMKSCNVCVKNAEGNVKTNEKQEADGKKGNRQRRKRKGVKKGLMVNDEQTKMTHVGNDYSGGQNNGGQVKKFSREEMEALRFVNIVQQRQFWKDIYTGLGDAVVKEYDGLASSRHHQNNAGLNFDPRKQFGKTELAPGILGEVCSENDDELQNMGVNEVKNMTNFDPRFSKNIGSEDAYMEGESYEEENSDEDYGSIQRPAFHVEGEPDFDSGPPEDGLEYLRRVRWEASHIHKIKVVKLDRSKVNKEQSIYMPQIPEITKCPEHLMPLKQWEDAFLSDFSNLRMYLSRDEDSSSEISCKLQSLAIDQANAWDDEISRCFENAISTSVSDSSSSNPTLSSISAMDAVKRVSMLRKRISLIETVDTLSKDDCMWLFALCAAVDTPVNADTCAALRSLLRKCASMRAAKPEVDDEVVMLNILITISGRYFGQFG
ncbi:uncharacterized protein LOC126664163 isoform X2 [Mercurialis annua]|uniref:uncharacterized protein LOC126664163 isoform X2 n=1 Tax=Mercurialis annua TaxID=3986 RepID=UPI00215F46D8|nr:uncharacterized protein LOC126664163 isoform X2 [Mercurialis annua]